MLTMTQRDHTFVENHVPLPLVVHGLQPVHLQKQQKEKRATPLGQLLRDAKATRRRATCAGLSPTLDSRHVFRPRAWG